PAKLDAAMAFRGYCGKDDFGSDVVGKVVVCFGGRRKGMVGADERLAAATAANAAGVLVIDDVGFTVEPPQWPAAYARSIALRGSDAPAAPTLAIMRLNPKALPIVLARSNHDAATLLLAGVAAKPLRNFDIPNRFRAAFIVSERDFTSENIIALLPGTDPTVGKQAVVVDAHIDGYGIGAPVNGDAIYNGAFDDAAYVASLIRLAQTRHGEGFRRPVIFAVFTGEEKGLLGSSWFTAHPPRPITEMAANITLDAIRPLFPFKILTLVGSDRSSLKTNVERVAGAMGITVRPDLEPERGMIRRTDASSFLGTGVPAVAFMFGYDPGSKAEAKFRNWYRTRYHKPQDDIGQPIDFKAAADFNRFFYALTEDIANADERPLLLQKP
ncbi:MAG: M28 family peptidase, partial [Sandarakinorhabdus sp.]|nr:M28 family peptidase [Sandarakinorhabdus sp.]